MISNFRGQYGFLSNFYPSPVDFEGADYTSVEHAFQAAKTLDADDREYIRKLPTPTEAKRAGRRVELRPMWDDIKRDVMYILLTRKFADPKLREELLATGDEILVEGNWWGDTYWGAIHTPYAEGRLWTDPHSPSFYGENHLGRLLMRIRKEIREEQEA